MSTDDNSGGWSEDPLHGKPFHNIQPREEHSAGGRCVTVKVCNQKKTSQEQIKRVLTTRCEQGQMRLCQKKHLKKAWQLIEKHEAYRKSNPGDFEGEKVNYSARAKSISWSQPDWACISLAEDKTKDRKPHKHNNWSQLQQRPGKASQKRKASLWWCPWDPDLRQSLPAKDSKQILKIIFMIILICPITFEPLKMGHFV